MKRCHEYDPGEKRGRHAEKAVVDEGYGIRIRGGWGR